MAKPQISGKVWFDVSEHKMNLKESVSVLSLNLSNLLA